MVMQEVSLHEVQKRLQELLAGGATRRETAEWAQRLIREPLPGIADDDVRQAVERLGAADLGGEPGSFLYSEADFHQWLDDVENAIDLQEMAGSQEANDSEPEVK